MAIYSSTIQELASNKMPQPYYRLDGSNDYLDISTLYGSTVDLDNAKVGSVECLFRVNEESTGEIVSFGQSTNNSRNRCIYFKNNSAGNNKMYIDLEQGNANKYRGEGAINIPLGEPVHVVFVQDGTEPKIYVNGVQDTITYSVTTDKTKWFAGTNNGWNTAHIGSHQSGNDPQGGWFNGSIYRVRIFNHALSSAEIKERYSGASVPFKYKGANQTGLLLNSGNHSNVSFNSWSSSGNNGSISSWNVTATNQYCSTPITALTVGKTYRIAFNLDGSMNDGMYFVVAEETNLVGSRSVLRNTGWTSGDHEFIFTADKAYDNVGFTKGYGSNDQDLPELTNWSFTQIGAVAEYDGSGIASDKWFDKSGNDLHGTVYGASVENAPSGDSGLVYEEGTITPTILLGGTEISTNSGTYNTAQTMGSYTRIGNRVLFNMRVGISAVGGATGAMRVAGLPYTPASSPNAVSAASLTMWVISYADTPFANIDEGMTSVSLFETTNAGTYSTLTNSNIGTTSYIQVAGQYHI